MSESVMEIDELGDKLWRNSKVQLHRTDGPAIEGLDGYKEWWLNGEFLDYDDKGFWKLWDRLTPEQKKDPVLLSYLPGDFNV